MEKVAGINLSDIQNSEDLYRSFSRLDADGDARLSETELKGISRYDGDGNGTVEVYELMTAVDKNRSTRGVGTLFGTSAIDRLRQAYGIAATAPTKPGRSLDQIVAVDSLLSSGLSETQIESLQCHFKRFGDQYPVILDYLGPAVKTLASAGSSPAEIKDFLIRFTQDPAMSAGRVLDHLPENVAALEGLGLNAAEIREFLLPVSDRLGKDLNGVLNVMSEAVKSLQAQGLSKTDVLAAVTKSLQVAGKDSQHIFANLPKLLEAGLTHDQAMNLLWDTYAKTKPDSVGTLWALGDFLKDLQTQGFSIKDALRLTYEIVEEAKGNADSAFELLTSREGLNSANLASYREGLSFLLKTFPKRMDEIVVLSRYGAIDLSKIRTREDLALWAAKTINDVGPLAPDPHGFGAQDPEKDFFQASAALINHLHDSDQSDDVVRKTIIKNLSPESVCRLLALGGSDLYPSTFRLLYERMAGEPKILDAVKEMDAAGTLDVPSLMLTLAGFNKLWDIFSKDPAFFEPKIGQLLTDAGGEDLKRNASLLQGVVGQILDGEAGRMLKLGLEQRLLASFHEMEGTEDGAAYAYLIKLHADRFDDPEARKIAAALPEIPEPRVPRSQWLADNKLAAKLYFYEDEKDHFQIVQSDFQKFAMDGHPGATVEVSKDKLTRTAKDADGNLLMTIQVAADGRTAKMTRNVNGIEIEVTITFDKGDVDRVLDDPDYDIVGHRGHSFHLAETFDPSADHRDNGKLVYLGSCGGFRELPGMMENYRGNQFIADEDTGRGQDNNANLYYLMESVAQGEDDWSRIYEYVSGKYPAMEGASFVFPNDPAIGIFDYAALLTEKS